MEDLRSAQHPYHIARIRDRSIQELLGMIKGIVADHDVSDAETVGLTQWLTRNPEAASCWPGSALVERLSRILEDGVLEDDERAELAELLMATVGEDEENAGAMMQPTRLPLTQPAPTILFDGRLFVFTGTFLYGTRAKCEAAVSERGGWIGDNITYGTNYLVIGTGVTGAWKFSTHGRKIEKAMQYNARGASIAIISEDAWAQALQA